MSSKAKRVALLARPGAAEQRLAAVLAGAGVDIVLQADPTQVEADAVLAAQPETLLVALDAPTEDALERLEAALDAPTVDVIFEEAALVVAREGWDAARWQRHLLAKLQGHRNVLPPAAGSEAAQVSAPAEVRAETPARPATEAAGETPTATEAVGGNDAIVAPLGEDLPYLATADETPGVAAIAPEIELELPAATTLPDASLSWTLDPGPEGAADYGSVDLRLPDMAADDLTLPPLESAEVDKAAEEVVIDAAMATATPLAFNPFDPVAPEVGEDAAGVPEVGEVGALARETEDASSSKEEQFRSDLASLELRIASMSLVDDAPVDRAETRRGAVLVLAGIGGPDAVRQLLGSLPTDFGRPVLVQQRLDGARYDRLVAQMQRATPLPVKLAEAGQAVATGTVYILPDGVGVRATEAGLVFHEGGNDVLAALPANDSAVLMLSGSDPACVDAVLNFGWNGGLVIGQSTDGCYDAAAVTELVARGGTVAKPSEMGPRLATHWAPGR